MQRAERPVEVYFHQSVLLPAVLRYIQVIDGFLYGLTDGTHGNDNMFRVRRTVIIKQSVLCTDAPVDFFHIVFHGIREGIVIRIAGFPGLKVNVGVLGGTHHFPPVWMQGVTAESVDGFHISHVRQIGVIPDFNFLHFMGGTETVKKIKERNPALDGG